MSLLIHRDQESPNIAYINIVHNKNANHIIIILRNLVRSSVYLKINNANIRTIIIRNIQTIKNAFLSSNNT